MRHMVLAWLVAALILSVGGAVAQEPAPTPPERSHLVVDGDNLYGIAARYGVTVISIVQLNNLSDFNQIRIGQRLRIPAGTSPLAPPSAQAQPTPAPTLTPFPVNQASAVGFGYGVQVYLPGQDAAAVVANLQALGVSWAMHPIEWARYERTRGQVDFEALDAIITPLDEAGLNILLTLVGAPEWSRETAVDDGPPLDVADFARFAGALAERYSGVVDAYEIWSEPNLRRFWNAPNTALTGEAYLRLLRPAYNAIKSADPAVLVVSAGLAPTATDDGVIATDDRAYLRQMYAAGLAQFSDAIGVHAGGWANPPDSACCANNRPAVPAWDDQPAFFFLETLRDYRAIQNEFDDDGTFLWVTDLAGAVRRSLAAW
ncbi:MAG: LysM peptidoglycan-binding domain-containing protein [Anaerolineae bacterium]|nr:LysM peptidoglycan-binding domain-containing protein [Anaerolineae bacterium]